MNNFEAIDWHNHDGVNRDMINDFMRNQFYDNIFSTTVRDRHCVDIGFGTGLLSVMAIKHGARSIIAYESDPDRYKLGQFVIEQLDLKNITLLNQRFNHAMLDNSHDVVFTETVNGNLWQEGLFNSLPRQKGFDFLPGQYFLELYACQVPDSFAQGLVDPVLCNGFSPGVDIDARFVELINNLGFSGNTPLHAVTDCNMKLINTGIDTEWGWIPYHRLCVNTGELVAGYVVDANSLSLHVIHGSTVDLDFEKTSVSVDISTKAWKDSSIIIVPRVGMRHGKHKLMLDTGHWGPTHSPLVLQRPNANLRVTHNFSTGNIFYDYV